MPCTLPVGSPASIPCDPWSKGRRKPWSITGCGPKQTNKTSTPKMRLEKGRSHCTWVYLTCIFPAPRQSLHCSWPGWTAGNPFPDGQRAWESNSVLGRWPKWQLRRKAKNPPSTGERDLRLTAHRQLSTLSGPQTGSSPLCPLPLDTSHQARGLGKKCHIASGWSPAVEHLPCVLEFDPWHHPTLSPLRFQLRRGLGEHRHERGWRVGLESRRNIPQMQRDRALLAFPLS